MRRGSRSRRKSPPPAACRNISVVLVEPQSPGNVGSTARAMRNTGFADLVLINPCDYKNNESYSMACKADGVLETARVFPDLESFIPEPRVLVGTTRRIGRHRYPVITLSEAVPEILRLAASNRVAILFGREDKGLLNEEIPVFDMLVEIPTSDEYPSINLSHAVFTVCHHLYTGASPRAPAIKVAPRGELEQMYEHMERTFRGIGYGDKGGEYLLQAMMRSFRRLLGRTGLMQKEVNMLRGVFTQIEARTDAEEERTKRHAGA